MQPYSFTDRWLLLSGIPESQVKAKSIEAKKRAQRYPAPHRWLWFINLWIINWFGPVFIFFQFKRAGKLSDDRFELFIRHLREHPVSLIRLTGVFALAPLIEVLIEDKPPNRLAEHPLEKYALPAASAENGYSDVIIIGSGAGGAPAALELSRKGLKVTVIEKGEVIKLEAAARMIEKYYVGQGLTVSLNGGLLLVLAGSTVGGTTSVNSGTCLRPLKECLSIWDEQLNTNFAGGALNPYIEAVEEQIGVGVLPRSLLTKSAILFEKGLNASGRPGAYVLPRNAPACQGSGRCYLGCPTGSKLSTDYSYLPQAVKAGARLLINTKAGKIVEKKDSVLVEVKGPDGVRSLRCERLIIAGGALYTPGILRSNHLGAHWRQAGKHLKIHPATKVFAYFP
ncbi:MAG: GMC family oxidoreductase N-terminal domain-containing protein, partial [Bacteroidetes bacterium]|nr:GMC family oxidoreductase N-terminal domain-containing protein [Bacteroidota bacterium]